MKQLLIVRHAESSWGSTGLEDFNRPLTLRGNADAVAMAEKLVEKGIFPRLLVSSPALRAISTAKHFADILKIDPKEIREEAVVYEASAEKLLHLINHFDEHQSTIALFGHNPGITNLLINLCGSNIYNIPPCGMCCVSFPFESWKLVSGGTGELKFFEYPGQA